MLLFLLGCRVVEDPDAGVCPAWSGLSVEGQTWSWERFADDVAWEASLETLDAENVSLVTDDNVSTYRCDDEGAWALERREGDDTLWTKWSFDPPYLVVPRSLEVGSAWASNAAWNLVRSDGTTEVGSASTQFYVEAEVESVVPAGSFSALQVRVMADAGTDSWYFARDVGVVLTDTDQLLGMSLPE